MFEVISHLLSVSLFNFITSFRCVDMSKGLRVPFAKICFSERVSHFFLSTQSSTRNEHFSSFFEYCSYFTYIISFYVFRHTNYSQVVFPFPGLHIDHHSFTIFNNLNFNWHPGRFSPASYGEIYFLKW